MPYTQSKKTSDTEKKLQALKLQFYGKDVHTTFKTVQKDSEQLRNQNISRACLLTNQNVRKSEDLRPRNSDSQTQVFPSSSKSELFQQTNHHYLKKDLIKTLILASLALGIQLAIFFSLNKGLIHF